MSDTVDTPQDQDAPPAVGDGAGGLRPGNLDEFVGQPNVRNELGIVIGAAKARKEMPEHLLITGPPGHGKTTLGSIIANELGVPLIMTTGTVITEPRQLINHFFNLNGPVVIFIDEIHGLSLPLEELLYPILEDGAIDIPTGEGVDAKTMRVTLPSEFTVVGATTRAGDLSRPLMERFGYTAQLEPYSDTDLSRILQRSSSLLGIDISDEGALALARRSTATPRVANQLLRRVRDYAQTEGATTISADIVAEAMSIFGIDDKGLDRNSVTLLRTIAETFRNQPVGLSTLSKALNESPRTVEESLEPHLIRSGLLSRTKQGRIVTSDGLAHLGIEAAASTQPTIFALDKLD